MNLQPSNLTDKVGIFNDIHPSPLQILNARYAPDDINTFYIVMTLEEQKIFITFADCGYSFYIKYLIHIERFKILASILFDLVNKNRFSFCIYEIRSILNNNEKIIRFKKYFYTFGKILYFTLIPSDFHFKIPHSYSPSSKCSYELYGYYLRAFQLFMSLTVEFHY